MKVEGTEHHNTLVAVGCVYTHDGGGVSKREIAERLYKREKIRVISMEKEGL